LKVYPCIFPALTDTLLAVGEPGTALVHNPFVNGKVEQVAFFRDAFTVKNVEFDLFEGWRYLVLDHFDLGTGADDIISLFQCCDLPDVHSDRCVEFEGIAAGSRFRISEHHADLHPDLVYEDDTAVRFRDDAGQFSECLRHETGLQAHVGVTHLAFDFRFRNERCDRVYNQNIYGSAPDEGLGYLKRLLSGVGLGNEQVVGLYAEFPGITYVESMLGIDKSGNAAQLLRFSCDMERQSRLSGGFKAKNFYHPAAGNSADPKGNIEGEGTGGDRRNIREGLVIAKPHNRTFAKLLLYLADRQFNSFFSLLHQSISSVGISDICRVLAQFYRHLQANPSRVRP